MLNQILTVLAPVAVSIVAQGSKYLVPILQRVNKTWLIALVAVLSFLAAIAQSAMTGNPVDVTSIQVFTDTLMNLIGATGVYLLSKNTKKGIEKIG